MVTVKDSDQANLYLKNYEGGNAHIISYTNSLKRILIRVSKKVEHITNEEVIYIVGASCEKISGTFNWINCKIHISDEIIGDESYTNIIDKDSNFYLRISGGLALFIGKEEEFVEPFQDLL